MSPADTLEAKQPANIAAQSRGDLAHHIDRILADYVVYWMKLQNVHWNLTGPLFYQTHLLTEEHYREVFETIDELAERIRALDERATGSLAKHLQSARLAELGGDVTDAGEMLDDLLQAAKKMSVACAELRKQAEEAGDEVTVDKMNERQRAEDKFAWMLRSLLG